MADDIRTRLSEALDENQREIDGRDGARVVPLKFRGEWRAADRPLAEALVERDRQLLADFDESLKMYGPYPVEGAVYRLVPSERHAELERQVERAAAFWLGTQEADR